jgi:hypothetical protein
MNRARKHVGSPAGRGGSTVNPGIAMLKLPNYRCCVRERYRHLSLAARSSMIM